MEKKYYASKAAPTFLTLTDHQGTLRRSDLVKNLMRMLLMDKGMEAQTALEELNTMPKVEYRNLLQQAEAWMQDNDLQAYMERKNINPGMKLEPIAESQQTIMEILDEFPMEVFLSQELPQVEWDWQNLKNKKKEH